MGKYSPPLRYAGPFEYASRAKDLVERFHVLDNKGLPLQLKAEAESRESHNSLRLCGDI